MGEVVAALTCTVGQVEDEGELTKILMTKLSETEHRIIKARTAEAGQDMQFFVRGVLRKLVVL